MPPLFYRELSHSFCCLELSSIMHVIAESCCKGIIISKRKQERVTHIISSDKASIDIASHSSIKATCSIAEGPKGNEEEYSFIESVSCLICFIAQRWIPNSMDRPRDWMRDLIYPMMYYCSVQILSLRVYSLSILPIMLTMYAHYSFMVCCSFVYSLTVMRKVDCYSFACMLFTIAIAT